MSAVHSVVRLLADPENRVPEGGGMLVSPRHVLTCAHVFSKVEDGGVVHFDFPYFSDVKPFRARRIPLDSDLDFAVLEIVGKRTIPETIAPVLFMDFADECFRADVEAYGFPADFSTGDWAYGKLIGKTADGFFQIDQNSDGKFVQPGFSGTPGWMDRQRRVIGMVAQRFLADGKCSVYLIPAKTLADQCKSVGVDLQFAEPEAVTKGESDLFAEKLARAEGNLKNSTIVQGNRNIITLSVEEGLRIRDEKNPPIHLSYYRIDRSEQVEFLQSSLKDEEKGIVTLAMHGHVMDCLSQFVACVREYYWESQLSTRSSHKPKLILFNWPWKGKSGPIQEDIVRELSNKAGLPDDWESPMKFNEATEFSPIIVFSCFFADSLGNFKSQKKISAEFQNFWLNWPARSVEKAPLLAILGILYTQQESKFRKFWPFGWPFQSSNDLKVRSNFEDFWGSRLMPCLEAVSKQDVLHWTNERDVFPRCSKAGKEVAAEVHEIFEDQKELRMADLVKALVQRFPM